MENPGMENGVVLDLVASNVAANSSFTIEVDVTADKAVQGQDSHACHRPEINMPIVKAKLVIFSVTVMTP